MQNAQMEELTERVYILEEELQNALNENAKLQVKLKVDEEHRKGLESELFLTKTYCDTLTEALQRLAGQFMDVEKDKQGFEKKLSARSALDVLHGQLMSLSSMLESSEEIVRNREKELKELCFEKEKVEKSLKYEQNRVASLLKEQAVIFEDFEATIEKLNSEAVELLCKKENALENLRNLKENLDKERDDLRLESEEESEIEVIDLPDIETGSGDTLIERLGGKRYLGYCVCVNMVVITLTQVFSSFVLQLMPLVKLNPNSRLAVLLGGILSGFLSTILSIMHVLFKSWVLEEKLTAKDRASLIMYCVILFLRIVAGVFMLIYFFKMGRRASIINLDVAYFPVYQALASHTLGC